MKVGNTIPVFDKFFKITADVHAGKFTHAARATEPIEDAQLAATRDDFPYQHGFHQSGVLLRKRLFKNLIYTQLLHYLMQNKNIAVINTGVAV